MSSAHHIEEPEMQFGASQHIDIRFGLRDYGPFDVGQVGRPQRIRVGVVGTPETVDKLTTWLEALGEIIPPKESRFVNRYVGFPGWGDESMLQAPIEVDDTATSTVSPRQVERLLLDDSPNRAIAALANRFFDELQHLDQSKSVDVLICAPPDDVRLLRYKPTDRELGKWDEDYDKDDPGTYPYKVDFHDLLKAQSLLLSCPTQLVWSPTYTGVKMDLPGDRTYPLQDEATRAWNFYVALYYKAGGTPWRLVRDPSALETCFVGVSFYQSLDWKKAHGSAAQIFNERGEGLIMQGGPAEHSRDDRQLHLSLDDARQLLAGTLRTYRREHGHAPARLVLHKTSPFSEEEKEGF